MSRFKDKRTEAFDNGEHVPAFQAFEKVATRKLDMVLNAERLGDLRAPPANQLEALVGNRKGQHSIRINDQWRVCFRWEDGRAVDIEIVDYH
jgi:proteic killer suppression protein